MKSPLKIFFLSTIAALSLLSCRGNNSNLAPKNVIFIIGDGTGFNQIQAAGLYLHGEENKLTSQNFPVQLAVSTYSASGDGYDADQVQTDFAYLTKKTTDSGASGTAMATGVKTYNGAIGVDTLKQELTNVFELAEAAGKATGVVTSVPFSHATPATFIAHNESRGNYTQIAHEMILESAADVIIGCGHPHYDDDGKMLEMADFKYVNEEDWNAVQNGSAGIDADADGSPDPWTFVDARVDFQKLADGDAPKRLLGIPRVASTLQANRSGRDEQKEPFSPPLNEQTPTLPELARAAINVLDADPDGFYLMIEAGAIDWACHANHGPRLVEESIDLEYTVQAVCEWVKNNSSWNETLVVITADHETGYLTGPGSGEKATASGEMRPAYQPLKNNGAGRMPGFEFHSGGHTNSLVPLFARGAGAEQFYKFADLVDPVLGPYLDNAEIAHIFKSFVK